MTISLDLKWVHELLLALYGHLLFNLLSLFLFLSDLDASDLILVQSKIDNVECSSVELDWIYVKGYIMVLGQSSFDSSSNISNLRL